MKPFPPADKLSFLVGGRLTQICLNPYTLDLVLDNGGRVCAEHVIEFVTPDGSSSRHDIQRTLGSAPLTFHHCINREVVGLDISDLRLTLRFDNGSILYIESKIGPYESGHISYSASGDDKHHFIVF